MVAEVIIAAKLPRNLNYLDYLCPTDQIPELGQLVKVNFRNRQVLAIVTKLKPKSQILKLKTLILLYPVIKLPLWQLKFISWFSNDYWVSTAQVVKTFLPEFYLKKPLSIIEPNQRVLKITSSGYKSTVIYCPSFKQRQKYYTSVLKNNRGPILIIVPTSLEAKEIEQLAKTIYSDDKIVNLSLAKRSQKLNSWLAIHQLNIRVVIGCRTDILVPVNNLSKIIIDISEDENHFQTESQPRFNTLDCLESLARLLNCPLIKLSIQPSVSEIFKVEKKQQSLQQIKCQFRPQTTYLQITELNSKIFQIKKLLERFNKIVLIVNFTNQLNTLASKISTELKITCQIINSEAKTNIDQAAGLFLISLGQKRLLKQINSQAIIWNEPHNLNLLGDYFIPEKIKQNLSYLQALGIPLYIFDQATDLDNLNNNWLDFAKNELVKRQKYNYPPFSFISRFIFQSLVAANSFRQKALKQFGINLEPSIKIKEKHGYYLIFRYSQPVLLEKLKTIANDCILDKNPQSVLY